MFALAVSTLSVVIFSGVSHASAVSGWNAGLIMDDSVMADKSTMGVNTIQSFLNSKVAYCDTNGTQPSEMNNSGVPDYNHDGTIQRWEWGKYKYNQTTFPCLKSYTQGGKTAAQLIYNASQTYSINPQVLITLLQKEQGLVTDTWPLNIQYRSATGYGCPDGAACNSAYYGLTNQLKWAATMFRSVLDKSSTWYSPYVVGNNYVQYNPSTSCGGTTVNIKNLATAALYDYTPYQPNTAALSAGYGMGNSCSSYGNRNFFLYFNDWFGSTLGTPFFNYNGNVYIDGDDNTYYHVPSNAVLRSYGYGTIFKKSRGVNAAYINSHTSSGELPLLARFGDDANIYAIATGKKALFPDRTTFADTYGFTIGEEAILPPGWIYRYASLGQMNSIMKLSDGPSVFSVESGKKRHIGSSVAYATLGSPIYNTRASTTLDTLFANSIPNGAPILTDGTVAKATDTGNQYIWTNGKLNQLTTDQKTNWRVGPDYQTTASVITQLPVNSTAQKSYITSGDGAYYIVGQGRRFSIATSAMPAHGLSTSSFQTVSTAAINRFVLTQLTSLNFVRINGSAAVSKVQGTSLYSLLTRSDFETLGGKFENLISIPTEVSNLYTPSGGIFPDGRLIQVANDSKVYILDSWFHKYYIPSPEIAKQYGIKLTNIEQVTSDDLSSYPDNGSLTRIIKAPDSSYWLVDRAKRILIANNDITSKLGYTDTSSFANLSAQLFSRIPNGGPFSQYLRDVSNGKVYYISGGQKHLYTSRKIFERHANWSSVKDVSHEFLTTIANGTNIAA